MSASSQSDGIGWVTDFELRQPGGMSHDAAFTQALDLAEKLNREGYDVVFKATLPDEPTGPGWFNADGEAVEEREDDDV